MIDKDTAWKDYELSLQDSSYMSRLKNADREKDFKAGFEAHQIDEETIKRLIDYIYDFAWRYGRYFHLNDVDKICKLISQKMNLPEEAIINIIRKNEHKDN